MYDYWSGNECDCMNILLIGAGKSGVGIAHLLSSKNFRIELVNEVEFSEADELRELGVDVRILPFESLSTDGYDLIIKAPGVPGFKDSLNEIEVAYKYANKFKLYAFSGTNGKTTTTNLLYSMLKRADVNALALGNIGQGFSEAVYQYGNSNRKIALELSSFQLEGLKDIQLEAYGLLNLSPDHLDRYDSIEDYFKTKMKGLYLSKENIVNIDDDNIMQNIPQDVKYYSLSNYKSADIMLKRRSVYFNDIYLFEIDDIKVPGEHNLKNAMFAAAMAHLAKVPISIIQKSIREFNGVAHRLEFLEEKNGVTYYNDSKATNPEATEVCLKAFDAKIRLIAGGLDENMKFDVLKKYQDKLAGVYLFGESANLIKEVLPKGEVFETLEKATLKAHQDAKSGDTVVLSPACASYDQFRNFEERGNQFKKIIKTL